MANKRDISVSSLRLAASLRAKQVKSLAPCFKSISTRL